MLNYKRKKMNSIPLKLYHYTKINILENIIRTGDINFRATYFKKYSKDDYLWVKNNAKPIIEQICSEKGWKYDPQLLDVKPYIISFCKNPNSTYMWEHYGDNNKGMKLIIDGSLLSNVRHYKIEGGNKQDDMECILPCIYIDSKNDVKQQIITLSQSKILDGWEQDDKLKLAVVALKKKNPFCNEEEFRYIHLYSTIMHADFYDGNFYIKDDPGPNSDEYNISLLFPKDLLLGIEVGKDVSQEQFDTVRKYLINCGYDPLKIHVTKAK